MSLKSDEGACDNRRKSNDFLLLHHDKMILCCFPSSVTWYLVWNYIYRILRQSQVLFLSFERGQGMPPFCGLFPLSVPFMRGCAGLGWGWGCILNLYGITFIGFLDSLKFYFWALKEDRGCPLSVAFSPLVCGSWGGVQVWVGVGVVFWTWSNDTQVSRIE